MRTACEPTVLEQLYPLVTAGAESEVGDDRLLARFVEQHDGAAFAALLHRHGRMVLGVCRRLLSDKHAAEDVFQATFLLLAQKASSIRKRASVAGWLHGVARRLALKMRTGRRTRREKEAQAPPRPPVDPLTEISVRELFLVLDEELQRLPERNRAPVLLCYMEGESHENAARRLGIPLGTLRSRLDRGKEVLRGRLQRRGISLPAAFLTAALVEQASASVLSSPLSVTTFRAALQVSLGKPVAGMVSMQAASLAKEATKAMFLSKLAVVAAVLVLGLAGASSTLIGLAGGSTAQRPEKAPAGKPGRQPSDQEERDRSGVSVANVLNEALKAAREIQDRDVRALFLAEIGAVQSRNGQKEAARRTFQEAFEAADLERMKPADMPLRQPWSLLARLGWSQAKGGDLEAARSTFQRAVKLARGQENENVRLDALGLIGDIQAMAGDIAKAQETLAAMSIRSGYHLHILAETQAKAGDLAAAMRTVESLRSNLYEPAALAKIAVAQVNRGDTKGATAALQRAFQIADQEKRDGLRATMLHNIAIAQAQVEGFANARKTLERAAALRKTPGDFLAPWLPDLAIARAEAGDFAEARKLAKDALEVKRSQGLDEYGWPKLVTALARIGQLKEAYEILAEAANNGKTAENKYQLQVALQEIAQIQAQGRDPKGALGWVGCEKQPAFRAVAFLGVAQGLLQPEKASRLAKLRSAPDPGRDAPISNIKATPYHGNEYWSLITEVNAISDSEIQNAKTAEERTRAVQKQQQHMAAFGRRFLQFAEKYPDDPLAFDALAWVFEFRYYSPEAVSALQLLRTKHVASSKISRICALAPYCSNRIEAERFLRAVLAGNSHREVLGTTHLTLASLLVEKAERARTVQTGSPATIKRYEDAFGAEQIKQFRRYDPEQVLAEAEKLLERVVADYGDLPPADPFGKLGESARGALFALRHLRIGKTAPEIEGEDIDGKRFKLSDYRGKVVVLDFWGHW